MARRRQVNVTAMGIAEDVDDRKFNNGEVIDTRHKFLEEEKAYCPAVKHLSETGRKITDWFYLTTTVVMDEFAKVSGLTFEMEKYCKEAGKAKYCFY